MTVEDLKKGIDAVDLTITEFATLIKMKSRRIKYLIYESESSSKLDDLDFELICNANISTLTPRQQSAFKTYFLDQKISEINYEPSKDLGKQMMHTLNIQLNQVRAELALTQRHLEDKIDECNRYKRLIDEVFLIKKKQAIAE